MQPCVHSVFLPDRPTHLLEREGDGKRNILLGWPYDDAVTNTVPTKWLLAIETE